MAVNVPIQPSLISRVRKYLILIVSVIAVSVSCAIPRTTPESTPPVLTEQAPLSEIVKPAEREPEKWGGARCNDGSSFAFQIELARPPSQVWLIYLQGGGFCEDNALPCARRGGELSTSLPGADGSQLPIADRGILLRNEQLNPVFFSANHVFAHYCSSDAWSGASAERRPTLADPEGWYFSGKLNVQSMFEILIRDYGLDDTNPNTRILFVGGSAGGQGVQVNADTARRLLPNTANAGNLKLLSDGGAIIDFDDPNYRPGESTLPVSEIVHGAYAFWGASLNPLCEAAMDHLGEHRSRCFFEEYVYPYIADPAPDGLGLPLLIQYSSLDSFALNLHHIDPQSDVEAREHWRQTALNMLKQLTWVYSGGNRPYHTLLMNTAAWDRPGNQPDFSEMLLRFWEIEKTPLQWIFGNP